MYASRSPSLVPSPRHQCPPTQPPAPNITPPPGPRLDRLQLLGSANQHNLGSLLLSFGHDTLKLARPDHTGFVDDEDMLVRQEFAVICPLMFEARQCPRADARALFQALGSNARQRSALHLISRRLPGLARHAKHRAFAGPGTAADIADTARRRAMLQRAAPPHHIIEAPGPPPP